MEHRLVPSSDATARPASSGRRSPWRLLWLGVVAASSSGVLIRYASGAEPLAIAFWRCAAGAAVLALFARRRLGRVHGSVARLPLIAGAFLAIHFATWITSIRLTTVASSVLLVSTTPVFIAVAGWVLWNEKAHRATWAGIGIALAGTALIGGADAGGSSLAGDILAVIGAATAGGYYMTGQLARRDLGILEYATITYAAAAVLLLGACLLTGIPLTGFPAATSWALVGLIVGPQLLGHTLINFALKDIDPATVSVTVMAEPVLATALAFLLLGEVPSPLAVPGGAAILLGIYLVTSAHPMKAMVVE